MGSNVTYVCFEISQLIFQRSLSNPMPVSIFVNLGMLYTHQSNRMKKIFFKERANVLLFRCIF